MKERKRPMDEVAIYYRKDPSWMAKTPLSPPVEHSPDALVEVFHEVVAHVGSDVWEDQDGPKWLDYYFKKFQNIEAGDLPARLGVRSMMVGDIVTLTVEDESRAWQCEAIGWKEIRPEWLVNGDLPTQSPALVSLDAEET